MPRNMSFALTTEQIRNRTKTVTRRLGWAALKPGERFWAVEKVRGLKKGEKVKRITLLECVSNRSERLAAISQSDVAMEGFTGMTWSAFVKMFCREMGVGESQWVNRIEFKYIDEAGGTP